MSYFQAANSLRQAAEEKFTALVEARHDALDSYLGTIREDLTVFAKSDMIAEALIAYEQSYDALNVAGDAKATPQDLYIGSNPHPAGEKPKLDAADAGSPYSPRHPRFPPWLLEFLDARGHYHRPAERRVGEERASQ